MDVSPEFMLTYVVIMSIGIWYLPPQQLLFKKNIPFCHAPEWWAARTTYIISSVKTTNCLLYSNIAQILLLYKTWGCFNQFHSMKSLVVCYWYVKKHNADLWSMANYDIVCFMFKNKWHHWRSVLVHSWLATSHEECSYLWDSLID